MFDGPEHASYIAFCRALRLEREFEDGDAFWWPGGGRGEWDAGTYVYHDTASDEGVQPEGPTATSRVWLPRLDQLLTMLEEAGQDDVGFVKGSFQVNPFNPPPQPPEVPVVDGMQHGYCMAWTTPDSYEGGWDTGPVYPIREEAALRLWLAVTGRQVPAEEG